MSGGPIKEFRAGSIRISVWENDAESQEGQKRTFYTATLRKTFRDDAGNWKESSSFTGSELLRAELVIRRAAEFMLVTSPADRESEEPSEHE